MVDVAVDPYPIWWRGISVPPPAQWVYLFEEFTWRTLVRLNLADRGRQITVLRQERDREATSKARAASLGRKLLAYRDSLATAATATVSSATVELVGPVTADDYEDPETWGRIADGEPQVIRLKGSRPYAVDLAFTAEQLSAVLASEISAQAPSAELRDVTRRLAQAEEDAAVLRHHTWEELCKRSDIGVEASQLDSAVKHDQPLETLLSFNEIVDMVLTSDLARDLVRNGFLTSHFALYASSYYGTHVGPDALEYIRRCIEPGVADPTFAMKEEDVIQLLREQDAEKDDSADLFRDASIFNVSIVDYLLVNRPAAAAVVAQRLAALGPDEREFIATYMVQGKQSGELLSAMAPHWRGVIQYAAVDAPVEASARVALLNSALGAIEHSQYQIGHDAASVIEETYRRIDALTQPATGELAEHVMAILDAGGASLDSLDVLGDEARRAAVRHRLFPITAHNLRVLVPEGAIGLDTLAGTDRAAYDYALDHLDEYLAVVGSNPDEVTVVQDPASFIVVINDASKQAGTVAVSHLIDAAPAACHVPVLADVPVDAWPSLAEGNRTDPTFANVSAYIEQFGLDDHLGALLSKRKKILGATSASTEERQQLAVEVLAARGAIPSTYTRVGLAVSAQPGVIDAALIAPEPGDLVARLLSRRLVADDATAFSSRLMVDWATLEKTIAASKKFATFVSPEILGVKQIPKFLRSEVVPSAAKRAVTVGIQAYLARACCQTPELIRWNRWRSRGRRRKSPRRPCWR